MRVLAAQLATLALAFAPLPAGLAPASPVVAGVALVPAAAPPVIIQRVPGTSQRNDAAFGVAALLLGAAAGLARPQRPSGRALAPRMQFGGGDDQPRGLSRDNEPEEFFSTNMDDMTDEEKLKSPTVIIGLSILILPFIVGMVALQYYR